MFRDWDKGAIDLARRREAEKAKAGKPSAAVIVTVDQLMAKLREQNYRCKLSGHRFWTSDGGSYGPTRPTLDRIVHDGAYSDDNVRIVCLGIDSFRGRGSDEKMYGPRPASSPGDCWRAIRRT